MLNFPREIFSGAEKSIIEILEGKEFLASELERNFPFVLKGCTLFLVNVEGSRYEALNIVRKLYIEVEVISFLYNDNIIVLGTFDDVHKHATNIRQYIAANLYCKCTVSYGSVILNIEDIKRAYNEAKECHLLSNKFHIKEEVFYYDKMLFEKIIYNIDSKVKSELLNRFKDKFNLLDGELITTIEELINSELNISDAAKRLYIHRNTLIYRLDKITKETGFDIRNFKEAAVFITAFLIWKENKA